MQRWGRAEGRAAAGRATELCALSASSHTNELRGWAVAEVLLDFVRPTKLCQAIEQNTTQLRTQTKRHHPHLTLAPAGCRAVRYSQKIFRGPTSKPAQDDDAAVITAESRIALLPGRAGACLVCEAGAPQAEHSGLRGAAWTIVKWSTNGMLIGALQRKKCRGGTGKQGAPCSPQH